MADGQVLEKEVEETMLKGLVIAGNRRIYETFLREYNLNPQEYRYISEDADLLGYHKDTNPNLRFFLLDKWWDSPVAPGMLSPSGFEVFEEFDRSVIFRGEVEVVLIDKVTDPAKLPEFLSSENAIIREEAKKKLEELK